MGEKTPFTQIKGKNLNGDKKRPVKKEWTSRSLYVKGGGKILPQKKGPCETELELGQYKKEMSHPNSPPTVARRGVPKKTERALMQRNDFEKRDGNGRSRTSSQQGNQDQ